MAGLRRMPEVKARRSGFALLASGVLLFQAPAVFAAGVLFKCRDADGKVVLRDKTCHAGEREVTRTKPGDVSRQFTIIAPRPADPVAASNPVPAQVAGENAPPAARP
jgi:hypothetical protein